MPKLPLPSTIRKLKSCSPIRPFPTGKLVGAGLTTGGVTAGTGVGTVTGAGGREGETAESGSCWETNIATERDIYIESYVGINNQGH